MAVTSYGQTNDGRGHQKSHAAFKKAHEENTTALLNLADGLPEDAARPPYDPTHVDNQWPVMLHHATYGELTVGQTLKGKTEPAIRRQIMEDNHAAKKAALKQGYRSEPYLKPQIVVLDPAVEKAALIRERDDMKGQINALHDMLAKLMQSQSATAAATA